MRYFPKNSIYHSNLVSYAEQNGQGLPCMIVSEIRNGRDNVSRIVRLQPYQDEQKYWLKLENQTVEQYVATLPKNEWIVLLAEGSYDGATMSAFDAEGTYIQGGAPPANGMPTGGFPPQQSSQPAQGTGSPPGFPPASTGGHGPPAGQQPPHLPTKEEQAQINAAKLKEEAERDDATMFGCLIRATEIARKYSDLKTNSFSLEDIRHIGISLFIEMNRRR